MKAVRTILFVYCLAAILAGLASVVFTLMHANQLGTDVAQADIALAESTHLEQTTNARLKELAKIQRRERELYTGPEAVDSSVAVQDASALHLQAVASMKEAEVALQDIEGRLDIKRKQLLPLLALLMLHGAGAFFFSPIRQH